MPQPFSVALDKALADTLAKIPPGKPRQITGGITLRGVEGSFGWRLGARGSVSAYAAREWAGPVTAGARGTWSW
jgi:hypothetical protein